MPKKYKISPCRICGRGGRITYSRFKPKGYRVLCSYQICKTRKDKRLPIRDTKEEAVADWNNFQAEDETLSDANSQ